jgi:hypothetical protein
VRPHAHRSIAEGALTTKYCAKWFPPGQFHRQNMQFVPQEEDSISALPAVSTCGQTDEHVSVLVMIAPEAAVLVAKIVVLVGVGVVVLVEVVHATAATDGLAATPTGEETRPVSFNVRQSKRRGRASRKSQAYHEVLRKVVSPGPVPAAEQAVRAAAERLDERVPRVVGRRANGRAGRRGGHEVSGGERRGGEHRRADRTGRSERPALDGRGESTREKSDGKEGVVKAEHGETKEGPLSPTVSYRCRLGFILALRELVARPTLRRRHALPT